MAKKRKHPDAKGGGIPVFDLPPIPSSLDRGGSPGKFTPAGLRWFAQREYFLGLTHDDPGKVVDLLDQYQVEAMAALRESPMTAGLDFKKEPDATTLGNRLAADVTKWEYWAYYTANESERVKQTIASGGDPARVCLETCRLAACRSMFVFRSKLEETTWRGYTAGALQEVMEIWKKERGNTDEEFWQRTLTENAVVIAQAFSLPVFIAHDKAYVGGKKIDNSGGNVVDFLTAHKLTENVALVEIKTPNAHLVGQKYRGNAFAISKELTGACIQLMQYRESIVRDWPSIRKNNTEAFRPECLLIIGTLPNPTNDRLRWECFELYRGQMRDVRILTFDELFAKIEYLASLLSD